MEKKSGIVFSWMLLVALLASCASAINGGSIIMSNGLVQTQAPANPQIGDGVDDPAGTSKEARPVATAMPQSQATATSLIPKITRTPAPVLPPDAWKSMPIIPETVSARMRTIYTRGLQMGNNPHAFSKVGDCEGTTTFFLGSFDLGPKYYNLGEYQNLQPVIDYYTGSFSHNSVAVRRGFNSSSVLSFTWSDATLCQPKEHPLACEYRLTRPSISLIMLGSNDFSHKETFEERMRTIIEYTIEQGIVPVLATKGDNIEKDESINRTIAQLSVDYEVPLWNFWRALEGLPNRGMQANDTVHLAYAENFFDNKNLLYYGWPVRNLTALQVLDAVWRGLSEAPAAAE